MDRVVVYLSYARSDGRVLADRLTGYLRTAQVPVFVPRLVDGVSPQHACGRMVDRPVRCLRAAEPRLDVWYRQRRRPAWTQHHGPSLTKRR